MLIALEAENVQVAEDNAEVVFVRQMKRRRTRLGLSQSELADRVVALGGNLYQQTIAKMEAGKRSIRLAEADTLARALGTTVAEMLAGVDVDEKESITGLAEIEATLRSRSAEAETELAQTIQAREAATVRAVELQARLKAITDQLAAVTGSLQRVQTQAEAGDPPIGQAGSYELYRVSVQIGMTLRDARKAAGLTLEDVHERTGLPVSTVEAMEAGGSVMYRGAKNVPVWITEMAQAVGIDDEPLLAKYREVMSPDRQEAARG